MADTTANASVLRDNSVEELLLRLEESKHDLFRLRVKATTKELLNTNEMREKRREIARIQTILNEKSKAADAS